MTESPSSIALEVDYDDPAEALGRWMAELDGDEPAAPAFDDWMLLLAAASGGQQLNLPSRSPLGRASSMYMRGIITGAEFGTMLWSNTPMWNQLLSGVAAHRAASDWMGHLVQATLRSTGALLVSPLAYHYLSTLGAPQLSSRVWAMREGDTGSDFGSTGPIRSERAEHLMQEMGWNPGTQVESVSPARDPWEDRTTTGLAWIGWFGNALRNDDVVDAATQSRLHDGRPLVGRFEGWANYIILEPSYITAGLIRGIELVGGGMVTLVPSTPSPSGWAIRRNISIETN